MTDAATKPAPNNWPGPQATGGKPEPRQPTRMERVHRIAELMGRYRPALVNGKWRLLDMENAGQVQPSTYGDEDSARAGARLTAAYDIDALYDAEAKS